MEKKLKLEIPWYKIPWVEKTLMCMKLTYVLLLLATFQTLASATYSQSSNMSIKIENATVRQVLQQIEENSDYYFLYSSKLVDVERKVDIDVKNVKINDVLKEVFKGTNTSFRIDGRLVMLQESGSQSNFRSGQPTNISGQVKNTAGEPIPGVTVVIKGSSMGIVTDFDGNYSLSNVPGDATLVFSFIGMKTQEILVAGKSVLNVTMDVETIGVEEVVVTALGIKRAEKALGYSVQTVDGESLQKVTGVDVGTSLTGKVAGVLVQNSTDFNVEPTFTIRGETNPLIVIDGVAYSNKKLNDIAAEDIESMTVLKGATASALYGFRGEKGAILITTKNGSTGKNGISAEVTSNTMFNAGYLAIPEKQSVYGRGTAYIYDLNSDQSWGTFMDGSIKTQWDPFVKEFRDYAYLPVGKDNFKNFLEPGYITNNNVAVAFKTNQVAVRTSLNWTQNKGRYPNSMLDKYTYTLGGDIDLEKFKLASNMSYTKRYSPNMGSNGYTSYDPMYTLLIWSSADFNVLDYKDYWIKPGQLQNNQFGYNYETQKYSGKNQNNPYFDRYERLNEQSRDIFNADLTTSYEIAPWLKATIRSGLDFFIDRGQLRISQGSYTSAGNTSIPGIPYPWGESIKGSYMTGRTQGLSINSDALLTGNYTVTDKLDLEYLAGGTIFYDRQDNINAKTVGGLSIPGYFSLNASVNPAAVAETTIERQVNSVFGRLALSWDKFIFVDLTARKDWVSMLANPQVPEDDRSYIYPSVSGSFVISELLPESTMDWLDLLKLRSSWTQAKAAPSPYAINSVFTVAPGTWNDINGASAPESLYLNTYSPNSYATTEFGVQAITFKKRLTLDVTYYNKHIFDILLKGPLTSASGYTGIYRNIDEERTTRGWEVAVTATPVKTRDLQWDLGINWSTYKQVYTKLDSTYTSNFGQPWVEVGERTDAFVTKDYLRVPDGEFAGEFIYSNGRIQKSNYNALYGYSNPDWIWGVNTTLNYKNFSLFMSFDGVVGGLLSTRTESYMWQAGVHPESVTKERELDVQNPGSQNYIGDGVKVVSGSVTYDTYGNITSDTRVFEENDVATTYKQAVTDLHNTSAWGGSANPNDTYSRTFVKLRELSLTYAIPNGLLANLGRGFIKGASVSFVGQNVLFWSKDWKYSDPDGGVEDFADPSVRYLGANIKVSF